MSFALPDDDDQGDDGAGWRGWARELLAPALLLTCMAVALIVLVSG